MPKFSRETLIEDICRLFMLDPPADPDFQTVGDIFAWLSPAVLARHGKKANVPWFAANHMLSGLTGVPAGPHKSVTALETLLVREQRADLWEQLSARFPSGLPRLRYGPVASASVTIGTIILAAALAVVSVLVAGVMPPRIIPLEAWFFAWGINLVLGVWVLSRIFRPQETEIPPELRDVYLLGAYWREWVHRQDSEYPPEQALLWMLLRQMVADAAVSPLNRVRRGTALAELGFD